MSIVLSFQWMDIDRGIVTIADKTVIGSVEWGGASKGWVARDGKRQHIAENLSVSDATQLIGQRYRAAHEDTAAKQPHSGSDVNEAATSSTESARASTEPTHRASTESPSVSADSAGSMAAG